MDKKFYVDKTTMAKVGLYFKDTTGKSWASFSLVGVPEVWDYCKVCHKIVTRGYVSGEDHICLKHMVFPV
jgi:hypothetical protein